MLRRRSGYYVYVTCFVFGDSKIKMALKIDEEWIRQRVHLKHDNLGIMWFFGMVLCVIFTYVVVVLN